MLRPFVPKMFAGMRMALTETYTFRPPLLLFWPWMVEDGGWTYRNWLASTIFPFMILKMLKFIYQSVALFPDCWSHSWLVHSLSIKHCLWED